MLVHRHWLSPLAASSAAIGGSCFVDQLWFHLSRHYRQSPLVQRVAQRPAFARSLLLIERHPVWFVLLFRFAYGLRAVAPVAIGASNLSSRRFIPLNMVAAVGWGTLFTALGYWIGPQFEAAEARYGTGVALATAGVSVLVLVLALRRGRY